MSGEGPESIPTSADPRSKRPTKKRALTPVSAQAATVEALFSRPDQEVHIPPSSSAVAKARLAAPPEIVTNVQGSSAGAGSGEFHVYKASRRREYERLRQMDEEVRKEKDSEEFEKEMEERAKRDEEKTRRNRERREKQKARKAKVKGGCGPGGGGAGKNGAAPSNKGPRVVVTRGDNGEEMDPDIAIADAPSAVAEESKGIIIEED